MGKLIDDPLLNEVGKKYGKSGAQVALAWGIAHGRSVIPKSKVSQQLPAMKLYNRVEGRSQRRHVCCLDLTSETEI